MIGYPVQLHLKILLLECENYLQVTSRYFFNIFFLPNLESQLHSRWRCCSPFALWHGVQSLTWHLLYLPFLKFCTPTLTAL